MQSKQLLEDVKNEDFFPSEISEVINVWCWTSVLWGKFILLNIVKTAE